MARKYERKHETPFKKRLTELTPPTFRLDTAHDRFTADLHRLNYYFWSSEVALATTLSDYRSFEESEQPASTVLAASAANAFKPRAKSDRKHYSAMMSSLIVQLRWNYDTLGRYALVEAVAIAEEFLASRFREIVRQRSPSSFEKCYRRLHEIGVSVDPLATFRAQIVKLIRNHVVHERSTIHSYPTREVRLAIEELMRRAVTWDSSPEWAEAMRSASNQALNTTRMASKALDLPELFFVGIFGLKWISEFGDSVEASLKRFHVTVVAT